MYELARIHPPPPKWKLSEMMWLWVWVGRIPPPPLPRTIHLGNLEDLDKRWEYGIHVETKSVPPAGTISLSNATLWEVLSCQLEHWLKSRRFNNLHLHCKIYSLQDYIVSDHTRSPLTDPRGHQGCGRFAEIASELTKAWSSGRNRIWSLNRQL